MKYKSKNKRNSVKNKMIICNKNTTTGITLIALVITIAVLLILAGITIGVVFNDNGVIKKAQEAANAQNQAIQDIQGEVSDLTEELEEANGGVDLRKLQDIQTRNRIAKDDDGKTLVIPKGFKVLVSEGTKVDNGVVIEDKNGNQFVWVPVDNPSEMYGTDSNGVKHGKLYEYRRYNSSTSSYDTLEKPIADGWKEENGIMTIITEADGWSRYEPSTITRWRYYSQDRSSYTIKENVFDADTKYLNRLGLSSTSAFETQMQNEFNEMIKSVEKYGGFYIGRYETGNIVSNTETIPVVKKGATVANTHINWYYHYLNTKKITAEENSVKCGMIWSCQWDRTVQWLVESGNKTMSEITDSRSWGNYGDSTGEAAINSGIVQPAGTNEAWKANNIYDLAGNVYDWTMTASLEGAIGMVEGNARVKFGGCYQYTSNDSSTIARSSTTPNDIEDWEEFYDRNMQTNTGSRAMLYIVP